ncbi:MAG: TonB-dependent receptor [Bacteroidia bacterium]|nr:TonB-dependent receptor [Bacteroidia bacterium]
MTRFPLTILSYSSLTAIYCLITILGSAQNARITVSGKVTDFASGDPLVGATVAVPELNAGTYADEEGNYTLTIAVGNRSSLEVSYSFTGYTAQKITISVENQSAVQNVALRSEDYSTEEVVITATKGFAQSQSDVTVSIEVVKPLAIDLQATPSIDKTLSQIPGVDNQDGQINIRGSSGYAYGVGSRVMVTLDGLPLITGDAGTANLDLIPVDNISQVEVMKGASSVLYGSSALGGVINIVTSDPEEKPKTSLRLRYGRFGSPANPAIDWDGNKSAWSASTHIFHSRKIGIMDFTLQSNFIKESGYRQGTDTEEYRNLIMLKFKPKKAPGLSFGLNASVSVDSSGSILYWRGYYPDTITNGTEQVISGGALTPTNADGGYRKQLSTIIGIDPVIKYLTPNGKSLFWYRGRYLSNRNQNNTNQSTNNFIVYNDFLYQTTLLKKINWVTGATYTSSSIKGDSLYGGTYVFNGDTITSTGTHDGNSLGLYTQLDGKFGRLTTSLGFRYETVQIDGASRESRPVARAGLNLKLWPGMNIRTSFGQAFRVPSVAERFANTTGGGIVVEPNPNIQSEYGYSAEVGLRQGFLADRPNFVLKGYLDFAGFVMDYEDMVEFGITKRQIFPTRDIRFSSVNVANARISGLELTTLVSANWKNWFVNFNGGVVYLNPEDMNAVPAEKQLDLVNIPSDIVNPDKVDQPPFLKYRSRWTVRGSISGGYKMFSLTANMRYKSFVENIDQYLFIVIEDLNDFRVNHPNGDFVTDVILSADVTKNSKLSLTVDNITNTEYLIIPGYLAPQRKFTLQFMIRF